MKRTAPPFLLAIVGLAVPALSIACAKTRQSPADTKDVTRDPWLAASCPTITPKPVASCAPYNGGHCENVIDLPR